MYVSVLRQRSQKTVQKDIGLFNTSSSSMQVTLLNMTSYVKNVKVAKVHFTLLLQNLPGGIEENHEKPQSV
jgi:hypothetical protein